MSEQVYDEEIAPALMRLATRCRELGMLFTATVEYEPGKRGTTAAGIDDSNLDMFLPYMAGVVGCRPDDIMMKLARIVRAKGIPHSCITLERMGVPPAPEDR